MRRTGAWLRWTAFAAVAAVTGYGAAGAARACGPFFPNPVLLGGDAFLESVPRPSFEALVRLLPPPAATFAEYHRTPQQRDRHLRERNAMFANIYRVVDAHPDADLAGEVKWLALGFRHAGAGRTDAARAAWEKVLELPARERRLYSVEAVYQLGRLAGREAADPQRDPEARRAARARALALYARTRAWAQAQFLDPMGRFVDSLGWEAKIHYDDNTPDSLATAIGLYWTQHWSQRPASVGKQIAIIAQSGPLSSLRMAADRAARWPDRAAVMRAFAAAPVARAVFSLRLLCDSLYVNAPEDTAADATRAGLAAWRAEVAAARAGTAPTAAAGQDAAGDAVADAPTAALAWACYQRGLYDLAADWAALAHADDPLANWIRAKLAFRAGDRDGGAARLAHAVRALRHPPGDPREGDGWRLVGGGEWIYPFPYSPPAAPFTPESGPRAFGDRIAGDWANVLLSRDDYLDAADALLGNEPSSLWLDGAYLLERVLTTDEAARFVDARWPAPSDKPALTGRDWATSRTTSMIRGVVARRLAREGRWEEARAFYTDVPDLRLSRKPVAEDTTKTLRNADAFMALVRHGRDADAPADERATALWHAAVVMRHAGMELVGTEGPPDWSMFGGRYDPGPYSGRRIADERGRAPGEPPAPAPVEGAAPAAPPPTYRLAPVSDGERARLRASAPPEPVRFHYRMEAARFAAEAAKLWPDDDPRTAEALFRAGAWVWYYTDDSPHSWRNPAFDHPPDQTARAYWTELRRRCPAIVATGRYRPWMQWFDGEAAQPLKADEAFGGPPVPGWMGKYQKRGASARALAAAAAFANALPRPTAPAPKGIP